MRRAAVVACAALAWPAGSAAAADSLVSLPSSRLGLTPAPPLLAATRLPEQRIPGSVSSRQTVHVGVTAGGKVRALRVVQRLELGGQGDYLFAVGAPALEVRAVAGSRSAPGFRRDAILWQGFSPGRRELAADARLRVGAAAPALPLSVSLRGRALLLENTTAVAATAFDGEAPAAELDGAARTIRAAASVGTVADGLAVQVPDVRPLRVRVDAPLLVTGVVNGKRFRVVLGGSRPRRLVVDAPPAARPSFRVTARPFLPPDALAPPLTLGRTVTAVLRLARVRQYDSFLANPDPIGSTQAVYVYRLVPPAAVVPHASDGGDDGRLATVLAIAAVLAGLAGLAVVWARS